MKLIRISGRTASGKTRIAEVLSSIYDHTPVKLVGIEPQIPRYRGQPPKIDHVIWETEANLQSSFIDESDVIDFCQKHNADLIYTVKNERNINVQTAVY